MCVRRSPSGAFTRISWDDALAETTQRIQEVQRAGGADAFGVYLGNPIVHNHGATLGLQGLVRAIGSKNRFDFLNIFWCS